MPTLEEFREKQKIVEAKKDKSSFKPKRYAPYLLQEEVINNLKSQKQEQKSAFSQLTLINSENKKKEAVEKRKKLKEDPSKNAANFVNPEIIARLYGIRKKLMFYLVGLCEMRNELNTGPITAEALIEASGSTHKTIKKVLQTMLADGLIRRMKGKRGKGGFSIFSISNEIKNSVLEHKSFVIVDAGSVDKSIIAKEKNSSISDNKNILPKEWGNINLEPLKKIGFSETQLKQLFNKKLNTPEIIQESINHFSFGLERNQKVKKYSEPLNVLMGVLRKGQAWVEQNYQSPQESAQRQFLERKKAEKERLKQFEEEAYKLALEEWQKMLTSEQMERIAPAKKIKGNITPQHVKLSLYFREKIWPEKMSEFLVSKPG